MAENKQATQAEANKLPIPVPVIVAGVVVALALGAWAVLDYVARKNPPAPQVLTAEAVLFVEEEGVEGFAVGERNAGGGAVR